MSDWTHDEMRLIQEGSRRAYEPYIGEHDCWEECYLAEPQAGKERAETQSFRLTASPLEADVDWHFEGLEINLDEGLYLRESPVGSVTRLDDGKVRSVLIVEDEAILRESLKDWLTDSGYRAEIASEGDEALDLIEKTDFGLMLLDLRLPGRDGLEILREARVRKPDVKGIIITAYPEVKSAVEAMKLGAVDFLTKPLDLENLEKLVAEHVQPAEARVH